MRIFSSSKREKTFAPRVERFAHQQERTVRRQRLLHNAIRTLTLTGTILGLVYLYSVFRVRTIICLFEEEPCGQEQEQFVQPLVGKSIFPPLEVAHPYYGITIQKMPPQTLKVTFHTPQLLVSIAPDLVHDPTVVVTQEGIVLPIGDDKPSLTLVDAKTAAMDDKQKVEEHRRKLYEDIRDVYERWRAVPVLHIIVLDPTTIYWEMENGSRAIVEAKRVKEQLNSLQLLLKTPTIDLTNKEIDMRFQHPVVRDKQVLIQ